MSDLDIETRTQDFQVLHGKVKKRKHRHIRGERKVKVPRSDKMAVRGEPQRGRDFKRYHQDSMEETLGEKKPIDESQDEDIALDRSALSDINRQSQTGGEFSAKELGVLSGRDLTEAQRKEDRRAKAERLFGRERRKTKI